MKQQLFILFLILLVPLAIILFKSSKNCVLNDVLCELEYPIEKVYKKEDWVSGDQEFYYTFLTTDPVDTVKKYYDSILPTKTWSIYSILKDEKETKIYNLVDKKENHTFLIVDKKQDNSTKMTIEFHLE